MDPFGCEGQSWVAKVTLPNMNTSTFPTLPAALDAAPSGSTVQICPGTHDLNGYVIDTSYTIMGSGEDVTLLTGANAFGRIFTIQSDVAVEIQDLTLEEGGAPDVNGGAIYSAVATLTLRRVTLRNNVGSDGGAIWSSGNNLTMEDVTFEGNESSKSGGAVWYGSGSANELLDATGVTFTNNKAGIRGGALNAQGRFSISNGTFQGNQAERGGAIAARALNTDDDEPMDRTLTNVVLHGNQATIQGGALFLWVRGALQCTDCSLGFAPQDDNIPDDIFATESGAHTNYLDDISFTCTASMFSNTVICPGM